MNEFLIWKVYSGKTTYWLFKISTKIFVYFNSLPPPPPSTPWYRKVKNKLQHVYFLERTKVLKSLTLVSLPAPLTCLSLSFLMVNGDNSPNF